MRTLICYLITPLLWLVLIVTIENTKNNYVFSIDTIITAMTLFSLMLQNIKVKEITKIQDWLVHKINMYEFFIRSSHIFFILFLITAIIMPIGLNECSAYLIKFDELSNWQKLFKLIIVTSLMYSLALYFLSFGGKDIDNAVGDNTSKKYGLFYGLLFIIYITTKIT
ncbi:hypothetical protein BKK49_01655 [Rodentibacter rarus]|nr:hypothetical protein BKK49_01655 [Rodentibacter rarus]